MQQLALLRTQQFGYPEHLPVTPGALPRLRRDRVLGNIERKPTDQRSIRAVQLDRRGETELRQIGLAPDQKRPVGLRRASGVLQRCDHVVESRGSVDLLK